MKMDKKVSRASFGI